MLAAIRASEFAAGMLTDRGRILEVLGERARVAAEAVTEVALEGAQIELSDRATWWLALDLVAKRTGLDANGGLLWALQPDPLGDDLAWVLESTEESRSRAHDTDDSEEALLRALAET